MATELNTKLTGTPAQVKWANDLRTEWFTRYEQALAAAEEAERLFADGGWDAIDDSDIEGTPAFRYASELASYNCTRIGVKLVTGDGAMADIAKRVREAGEYVASIASADVWINRRSLWESMACEVER